MEFFLMVLIGILAYLLGVLIQGMKSDKRLKEERRLVLIYEIEIAGIYQITKDLLDSGEEVGEVLERKIAEVHQRMIKRARER